MAEDKQTQMLREKAEEDRGKAFSKTVKTFHESVIMSEIAQSELNQGGKALQELGGVMKNEVVAPFKNMASSFINVIPGFGVASKLGMVVWKNTFGENKKKKNLQKKEEELLAKRLGFTGKNAVAQLKEAQQRAEALKAEEDTHKKLADAAVEFGLVSKEFDAEGDADKFEELTRLVALQEQGEEGLVDREGNPIFSDEDADKLEELLLFKKSLNDAELGIVNSHIELQKHKLDQESKTRTAADAEITAQRAEQDFEKRLLAEIGAEQEAPETPEILPEQLALPAPDFSFDALPEQLALPAPDFSFDALPEQLALPAPETPGTAIAVQQESGEQERGIGTLSDDFKEFVNAATKPGSLFVHDTHVKEELESQGDLTGAAAQEALNEQQRKDDKLIDVLEGIEDNTEDLDGLAAKTDKKGKGFLASLLGGGGLFGGMNKAMAGMGAKFLPGGVKGLAALAPKAMAFLKVAGPIGIIVGGVVAAAAMVKSGVEGYNKAASGEWPVDKVSGAIGGALGGTGKGWANAGKQALKGAGVGALIGLSVGGPVGALIGGVVGAAAGGIAGFIGGETIAKWADGAVGAVRNLFNLPELLTPEQIAAAQTRLDIIKQETTTFDNQITKLKESLEAGNLTGKDRIAAMDELEVLEASKDKLAEEKAKINQRMANSLIAEKQAAVERASEEFNSATRSASQEKQKLFWLALRYGKDSEEYTAQKDRYDAAATWATESKKKLEAEELARDTAQKLHDETNKTMMGNVRLFWSGFKDSLPSWEDVKAGASAFLKDPLGTMKTSFAGFIPDITLPSWTDVQAGVTGFFKDPTTAISGAFSSFTAKLPDMAAIKNHMPDSLVAAGEWAADKLPLLGAGLAGVALPALDLIKANMPDVLVGAGEWAKDKILGLKDKLADIKLPSMEDIKTSLTGVLDKYNIELPSWTDVKAGVTGFLTNPKETLQGVLNKYNVELPSWEDVKAGVTGFLSDPKGTLQGVLNEYNVELPSWTDIKAGVTGFLKDPKGTLQGVLNDYNIEIPSWTDVKAGVTGFLKDPKAGLTTALQGINSSMPDFVTGTGDWAKEKMTAWKTALPEIKLPDLSEAMEGISEMASNAAGKVKGWFKGLFGKGEPEKEEAEKDIREQLDTLEKRRKFFKEATEKEWTKHFDATEYGDLYSRQKERLREMWEEEPNAYKNEMELLQEARSKAMDTMLGITMSASDRATTDTEGNEVVSSFVEITDALGHTTTAVREMTTIAGGRVDKKGRVRDKTTATSDVIFDPAEAAFMAEAAEEAARPKMEQSLDAAVGAGFYNVDWVGASEIDRKALREGVQSGLIQKEMLDNIIGDKDLRAEDLAFMKTLVERATSPGSLFVHDVGLQDLLKESNDFWKNSMLLSNVIQTPETLTPAGPSNAFQINTPNTTNQIIKNTMNTAIGTTDPFTTIARVF